MDATHGDSKSSMGVNREDDNGDKPAPPLKKIQGTPRHYNMVFYQDNLDKAIQVYKGPFSQVARKESRRLATTWPRATATFAYCYNLKANTMRQPKH